MKKITYLLILPLVVVSGLVYANHQVKKETPAKPAVKPVAEKPVAGQKSPAAPKPISAAEQEAAMKAWYATPAGENYKKWEESPAGIKVLAGAAKVRKQVSALAPMEAVITCLTLPPGSLLGFGMMARIDGVDYIITFDTRKPQMPQLQSLKVNDHIIIKGRGVSMAPKYAYPILSIDYVERDGEEIYKRIPPGDGC
ncbi:MAG: hypothetical protein EOO05_11115 [Chitinophagaceae bacterium]|nr:MAG: hypothetical protein EOO05_11115 [Chitinophagaceae bacterium]